MYNNLFSFESSETGREKYNSAAYSQGANQILICCVNSASVGCVLPLKTQLMHRLLMVTAGEAAAANPRNSSRLRAVISYRLAETVTI